MLLTEEQQKARRACQGKAAHFWPWDALFFAPLIVPSLQLREVNGHALVDSEGLTMLIPLCHTKCLISVGCLSLSLKY